MERLSSEFLKTYLAPEGVDIEIPNYNRNAIKAGIIHFGPGNFPLAHIAAKTHDLMQSGDQDALNYGVVTININNPDRVSHLTEQDGLYTLMEHDAVGKNKMTVVGSVIGSAFAGEKHDNVIAALARRDVRIVSMTITPQGHESYMEGRDLNLAHPHIVNDLDPLRQPKTIYGFLARAIQERVRNKLAGFTVMNLDNMEHNGDVIGRMLRQFIAAYDAALLEPLKSQYAFPNSMVDRIVPKTTPALLEQISAKTGFDDTLAVPAEPMPTIGSWVIEDKFVNGRPAWESLGLVQIVPDVLPYEQMKLRLLNVSHSFMANLGDLAGLTYIDETMNDPVLRDGTLALMNSETGLTLLEVPGIDIPAYKAEIIQRFANPHVKDTTWRVAKDAPLRVVLDSARDQIKAGGSYELLALNVAAWMRRFRVGANELGGKTDAVHPMADSLKAKAQEGGNDPAAMFSITEVFGDMGLQTEFGKAVAAYMELLDTQNVRAAIKVAMEASSMMFSLSNAAASDARRNPYFRGIQPQ